MKNLTDSELLDLAYKKLEIADKHTYSSVVLVLISLIQVLLLVFDYIGVLSFILIYPLSFGFYLYHKIKSEKYLKKVDEILNELTSRDL